MPSRQRPRPRAGIVGLEVLTATQAHIELYRQHIEQRALAASTIDRRLSTVCGFYRFAHIDGRITANPAQYVRRPKVHPSEGRGLDRNELGRFLFTAERVDRAHAALAVLLGLNGLRVSEACATNIEDLGFDRGHRTLRIIGKGNKPAVIPLVPRTARTIDLAVGERHDGAILVRHDGERLDRRTAHRWVRSTGKRAGLGAVHSHMLRAAFIMAALDAGVPLRDVQLAARHADPRTTTIYDRRENFDRHAAYVVVAFVAGT
jgi:integrase/recombinase XerD